MNKKKLIIILLFVFSAFLIHQSTHGNINIKASVWDSNGEESFKKPIDIVWRGEVISTMAGGACIGLSGEFDGYSQAVACLPNTASKELWKFEGMVTITGKLIGITCAYENTIFGECVPDVIIESIK